ncbi:MAG: hypothetical protein AB7R55_12200 [Gemmatimonadales bacterium]
MASKLSSKQLAKLAVLQTFPTRFDTIHRLVEELGTLRADESQVRRLARTLDQLKAAAGSIGETGLVDTLGVMGTLARRTGGLQTRVRGLREGVASLKINLEGAMRAATREEDKDQVDEADLPGS